MILKCRDNEASRKLDEEVRRTPIAECRRECERCVFNPAVSRARLAKGHFIDGTSMTCYTVGKTGKVESMYHVGGLRQLVFPRKIRED